MHASEKKQRVKKLHDRANVVISEPSELSSANTQEVTLEPRQRRPTPTPYAYNIPSSHSTSHS